MFIFFEIIKPNHDTFYFDIAISINKKNNNIANNQNICPTVKMQVTKYKRSNYLTSQNCTN